MPDVNKQVRAAVLIACVLGLLGMAWTSKADKSEVDEIRGIALDHLCTDHPAHRRCR